MFSFLFDAHSGASPSPQRRTGMQSMHYIYKQQFGNYLPSSSPPPSPLVVGRTMKRSPPPSLSIYRRVCWKLFRSFFKKNSSIAPRPKKNSVDGTDVTARRDPQLVPNVTALGGRFSRVNCPVRSSAAVNHSSLVTRTQNPIPPLPYF